MSGRRLSLSHHRTYGSLYGGPGVEQSVERQSRNPERVEVSMGPRGAEGRTVGQLLRAMNAPRRLGSQVRVHAAIAQLGKAHLSPLPLLPDRRPQEALGLPKHRGRRGTTVVCVRRAGPPAGADRTHRREAAGQLSAYVHPRDRQRAGLHATFAGGAAGWRRSRAGGPSGRPAPRTEAEV